MTYKYVYPDDFDRLVYSIIINRTLYETIIMNKNMRHFIIGMVLLQFFGVAALSVKPVYAAKDKGKAAAAKKILKSVKWIPVDLKSELECP